MLLSPLARRRIEKGSRPKPIDLPRTYRQMTGSPPPIVDSTRKDDKGITTYTDYQNQLDHIDKVVKAYKKWAKG